MSEQNPPSTEKDAAKPGSLEQEFAELGKRLSATAQTAWESDDSRRFRTEMRDALQKLADELDQGLKNAAVHPTTRKAEARVEQALESARKSELLQDAKQGLLRAIQTVNRELDSLIKRMNEPSKK